jgi:hypothetical protein
MEERLLREEEALTAEAGVRFKETVVVVTSLGNDGFVYSF